MSIDVGKILANSRRYKNTFEDTKLEILVITI